MENEKIDKTKRNFLSKLGIGSLVITSGGIFNVKKELQIVPIGDGVEKLDDRQIVEIAGSILDAIDGKNTNPVIYEAVRKHLTQGTIYEHTSRPEIESIGEFSYEKAPELITDSTKDVDK
jgi:hypothetical protein